MKKIFLSLSIMAFLGAFGQEITLDKIYSGQYRGRGISGISSLSDGEHYAVIEGDAIVKYSYANTRKIGNIIDGKYYNYEFSNDESKILLLIESLPIYRHSFLGKYQVKDLKSGREVLINGGKLIQEPRFSPDASKVAFVEGNNIFYQDLETGKITQITTDGEKNHILNGVSDWVYEEEFGHSRQYEWTKNSDAIVFVKSDETAVREVNLPIYQGNLYPREMKFKYPKAGEENSKVSAFMYQLSNKKLSKIDLSAFKGYYIINVVPTQKYDEIVLITSERNQNAMDILKVNTKTGKTTKLFTEIDEKWIDTDKNIIEFLEDNSFIWASERDGYRHLYWYNENGKLKKQITKGNWEVVEYYGFNPKTKEVFIQTTQNGSINKIISRVNINTGKSLIISEKEGNNIANFSKNYRYFIETSSAVDKPYTYTLKDKDGILIKDLQNNKEQYKRLEGDNFVAKEFFTIPNAVGDSMNAWIIKPKNFDKMKKYPVLMYQYSGPGSQSVENSWDNGNALWFNMLAQKGYLVVCVDGRGTGFRGAKYKKATYKNLGKYEIEDQITAAKWLGNQPYVDANRIGIFGWSFGGYMTSLALTKGADTFKLGIAVAPVTNWRYYDSIYTERFMGTPQEKSKWL